jgi:hypothetical protein
MLNIAKAIAIDHIRKYAMLACSRNPRLGDAVLNQGTIALLLGIRHRARPKGKWHEIEATISQAEGYCRVQSAKFKGQ